MTVQDLRKALGNTEELVPLAIILSSLEKPFLQAFHRVHPETMLVLWAENGNIIPTSEALACGVNELEILLYRLAQYYSRSDGSRRRNMSCIQMEKL